MFSLIASAAENILNACSASNAQLYLALNFSKMQVPFVSDLQHLLQKLSYFIGTAKNMFSGGSENIIFVS